MLSLIWLGIQLNLLSAFLRFLINFCIFARYDTKDIQSFANISRIHNNRVLSENEGPKKTLLFFAFLIPTYTLYLNTVYIFYALKEPTLQGIIKAQNAKLKRSIWRLKNDLFITE